MADGPAAGTGTPTVRCATCREENPGRARFCLACGQPLPVWTDGERAEVRKTVTIVFADIVGSTAMAETLDPEAVRRVLHRYFEEMRAVLDGHGGTVEKFIGDAVMAVFGVPQLHEDDALRAVRAAAEMRARLDVLNAELLDRWGVTLAMRVGVNTGEVVAADDPAADMLVTGDTVNVAARLEQGAAPGQILLGAATYRLVRDRVGTEPVEALVARGKSEPVQAFQLLDVRGPGQVTPATTRFIGRTVESDALRAAHATVLAEGRPHLAVVLGAAGVGKTRLVEEFVAPLDPAAVLRSRCLAYGRDITYWPVAEIIRGAVGARGEDDPEAAKARLLHVLAGEEDGHLIGEWLAQLVGWGGPPASTDEVRWAVRVGLELLTRARGALVLVVEDLHWADPALLDLLEHVVEHGRGPLLVVATARPEVGDERPGFGYPGPRTTRVRVGPLDEAASSGLLSALLDGTAPTPVRRRVLGAAAGNPLFIEELVASLREQGLLWREAGRWFAHADLDAAPLPPTVHALVAARIERLPAAERTGLQRAAIVGTQFDEQAVGELTPAADRAGLAGVLRRLVDRELVQPDEGAVGRRSYRFRHVIIRDAAYDALPKSTRAQLHARFAEWLAATVGDRAAEVDEILGHHLEQAYLYGRQLGTVDAATAHLADRAGQHLRAAGERALARDDVRAGANLLSRAAALPAGDNPERVRLLVDLGAALTAANALDRALAVLQEAVVLAAAAGDEVLAGHAAIGRRWVQLWADPGGFRVAEVDADLDRAIAAFERAGDDLGLARAWRLRMLVLELQGRMADMAEPGRHAIEHARRAGSRTEEQAAVRKLAEGVFWGPVPVPEAIDRLGAILEDAADSWHTRLDVLAALAVLHAMRGDAVVARARLDELAAIHDELGIPWANQGMNVGLVAVLIEPPGRAAEILEACIVDARAAGDRPAEYLAAAMLADLRFAEGDVDAAAKLAARCRELTGPDDPHGQLLWRGTMAKVLAARGEHAEAEALARHAVTLAEGAQVPDTQGEAWLRLAEVLRLGEKAAEAAVAAAEALARYEAKGNEVAAARVRAFASTLAPK